MSKKTLGIVLIIVGILIVVVMLGAGYIGLSASHAIGLKKALGAAVGAIVAIAGIVLMAQKS
jgi:hypothetical protein